MLTVGPVAVKSCQERFTSHTGRDRKIFPASNFVHKQELSVAVYVRICFPLWRI